MFIGLYMTRSFFSPSSKKSNLVNCLTFRAVKLCSLVHLADEVSNIKKIFLDNRFPEHVVNTGISNKLLSMAVQPKFGPAKCPHICTPTMEGTNFPTV